MTTTAICQDDAHVFTPLYPGWEPDAQTPCECGAVSYRQHQIAQLKAHTQAGIEREAQRRHDGRAPGPDVTVCEDCGGRMSPPKRGRRGQWVRCCTTPTCRCFTHTFETPPNLEPRGPVGFARRGDLPFTSLDTITRRPLDDVANEAYRDVRQRQAGSDE